MTINIYIHVPYCTTKCVYCGFYSLPGKDHPIPRYTEALCKEIAYKLPAYRDYSVATIYFGGGTPSLLSPNQIKQIISTVERSSNMAPGIEITLEGNPESLSRQPLREYRLAGVNRLSIGLQAWQPDLLKRLGRAHTREEFMTCFYQAREAGFDNVGVDLIFGYLPLTYLQWIETLTEVTALKPEHISCYSLEISPGSYWSRLYSKGASIKTSETSDRKMYNQARTILAQAGYDHYELSNWSLPSYQCRHNTDFWHGKPYIGFGPGASSWIADKAWTNNEKVVTYLTHPESQAVYEECLNTRDRWLLLRMRLIKGFSLQEYENRWKSDVLSDFPNMHNLLIQGEWLIQDKDRIMLTQEGLDRADALLTTVLG